MAQLDEIEDKLDDQAEEKDDFTDHSGGLQIGELEYEAGLRGVRIQIRIVKALDNKHADSVEEKVNAEAQSDLFVKVFEVEQPVAAC